MFVFLCFTNAKDEVKCLYFSVSQMQNNYFQWQFSVWHKTTFGIMCHSSSNCFDSLMEKISAVNLESIEV